MTNHNTYPRTYRGRRAAAAASLALLAACSSGSNTGGEVAATSAPISASATPEAAPIPTTTQATTTAAAAASTAVSREVKFTFYGAADNDPRGSRAVAHPEVQAEAGGTGTYDDPLTMAVKVTNTTFGPFGGEFYVPGVKKYFVYADECGSPDNPDECTTDVDLYIGNPSLTAATEACEYKLTPDGEQEIDVNPDPNLPVDDTPLWNDRTRQCGNTYWQ
jgi:hypothetical protein